MITAALICGLAGWRLASLLVDEDGPFHVFAHIRAAVGLPAPGIAGEIRGLLPEIFSCVFCMSVWTSAIMLAAWAIEPWIPTAIAAMGIAIVVERWVRS